MGGTGHEGHVISAFIFGFGGVELPPLGEAHLETYARRRAATPAAFERVLWGENWRELERGQIDDAEYHRRVSEALGFPDRVRVDR